jgi:hypothetical protein
MKKIIQLLLRKVITWFRDENDISCWKKFKEYTQIHDYQNLQ